MNELKSLDWQQILTKLKKNATSESAKNKLDSLEKLSSANECRESFSNIDSALEVLSHGQRPYMESLDLISTWLLRLEKNATLKTLELKDIRHFCIETMTLTEVLKLTESDWSKNQQQLLMPAEESLSAIDQIMTADGSIRNDASELLYKLNKEKHDQSQQIQKILDRLVKKFELEPVLQDRFVTNREGRWVLPVKSGMQHQFEGLIHAASHSKQTVFMEPQEVIPVNNRLRQIDQEIEAEIERLLRELSQFLSKKTHEFEQTKQTLLFCDLYFAKAQLSEQLEAKSCDFTEHDLILNEVRHPVLVLNNHKVIANNVVLDKEQRILILSGPNAGGKTVLLKSIGLAAHMARCGLPICAEVGCKIPFFSNIHIGVGDSQSVDEHLSTFAAHLKILDSATTCNGFDNLLLIDEICGSTDPEEGSALAKSFIHTYSQNNIFAVITSHLGALKKGWEDFSGIANGSLEFNNNTGPTYQFLMGIPGQSLAIQTAKRVGVDKKIIEQAFEYLSPEHKQYEKSLADVELIKTEVIQLRKELNRELKKHEKEKIKFQKMQQELEQQKSKILDRALDFAEAKLDKMVQEASLKETFKNHDNITKIKSEMPELIKATPTKDKSTFKIESSEAFANSFPPGSKVFVPQLNADGIIQGKPNTKGEVPILSNSMRLVLPWKDLKLPEKFQKPSLDVLRRASAQLTNTQLNDSDRIIDLRGLHLEDATQRLELQLDTAALNSEDRVKVIHGHGTESLKRGIRSHLSRSVYIKKWNAGTKNTGGDGVTWAELKD